MAVSALISLIKGMYADDLNHNYYTIEKVVDKLIYLLLNILPCRLRMIYCSRRKVMDS
jgi:hypothetical protein